MWKVVVEQLAVAEAPYFSLMEHAPAKTISPKINYRTFLNHFTIDYGEK